MEQQERKRAEKGNSVCSGELAFRHNLVGRGVSLGTTCLLSVVQAFTISPRNSRWGELKVQVLKCTGPCIILCWILYMLVNIIFPLYVTSKWNNKTITKEKDLGYCYGMWTNKSTQSLLAAVLTAPDVVCLGLMLWASISVVFTLYRHKQRVQYIHRNNISPRSSPETRAMQSTLVLYEEMINNKEINQWFKSFARNLYLFPGIGNWEKVFKKQFQQPQLCNVMETKGEVIIAFLWGDNCVLYNEE
ncbi:hypothetical protein HPG69_013954 [Diceros bicornis minor]|uniref:Vomeronasal type-1 receptor n=1 Tax=Diceros bicornis minor TaxID=77932 RepID=A0A7J7EMK2_DICBM|nr:hypothetical protein HPG69_013954 [Diceros bicornis minor]